MSKYLGQLARLKEGITQKDAGAEAPSDTGAGETINLHGWTLGQIKSHSYPDEWVEVQTYAPEKKRLILECLARDLRNRPWAFCGDLGVSDTAGPAPERHDHQHTADLDAPWRPAARAFLNHIFSCDECYAPRGRYCPQGAKLRTFHQTELTSERVSH